MNDQRKALHDLIEQTPEEDLPFLQELIARFQRPLDFPLQSSGPASTGSTKDRTRQELILEAHTRARSTHLRRQHTENVAKRLRVEPDLIEFAAGGASSAEGDVVEMYRHWPEGPVHCRLNTFQVDRQEIITLEKSAISTSGLEVVYKLRVLTASAESEAILYVPV